MLGLRWNFESVVFVIAGIFSLWGVYTFIKACFSKQEAEVSEKATPSNFFLIRDDVNLSQFAYIRNDDGVPVPNPDYKGPPVVPEDRARRRGSYYSPFNLRSFPPRFPF